MFRFHSCQSFLCLILCPQLVVIHHAYYLGKFTGSKTCLLATSKKEILYSVNFWWKTLFKIVIKKKLVAKMTPNTG